MRATRASMPKKVVKLEKPEKKVQKPKVYDSDSDDDVPQKRSYKRTVVNHNYYYQNQQPQQELKSRSVSPKAIEKPAPKPVSIEAPRAVRPVVILIKYLI